MTGILDIAGLEATAKEKREIEQANFSGFLQERVNQKQSEQNKLHGLLKKAMAQEREEHLKEMDKEIKQEQTELKKRREQEIEDKTGFKTERTVQKEDALLNMLRRMGEDK